MGSLYNKIEKKNLPKAEQKYKYINRREEIKKYKD